MECVDPNAPLRLLRMRCFTSLVFSQGVILLCSLMACHFFLYAHVLDTDVAMTVPANIVLAGVAFGM